MKIVCRIQPLQCRSCNRFLSFMTISFALSFCKAISDLIDENNNKIEYQNNLTKTLQYPYRSSVKGNDTVNIWNHYMLNIALTN